MIVIGCATNDERAFRSAGAPTIERIAEGSSLLLRRHRYDSIDVPYNEMLETAAARDDLDGLVFVHQDALLDADADVLGRVRRLLTSRPDVAVVGVVDIGRARERTAAEGTLLALSAWAVRKLCFDPALGGSADASAHDFALQARAEGKRVLGARLGVVRRWLPESPAARRGQLRAMVALRRKWEVA